MKIIQDRYEHVLLNLVIFAYHIKIFLWNVSILTYTWIIEEAFWRVNGSKEIFKKPANICNQLASIPITFKYFHFVTFVNRSGNQNLRAMKNYAQW